MNARRRRRRRRRRRHRLKTLTDERRNETERLANARFARFLAKKTSAEDYPSPRPSLPHFAA